MEGFTATVHGKELPKHLLVNIHKLAHAGVSYQMISKLLELKLEQVLANDPSHVASDAKYSEQLLLKAHPSMSNERFVISPKKKPKISESRSEDRDDDTPDLQFYEDTLPTFIYSYKPGTNQLHRTNLVTGEQSCTRVPSYQFKAGCCWNEVPGGSLLITGGGYRAVREVVRIDTRREFAVCQCPPMLHVRRQHTAVYHSQHLYVLGGTKGYSSFNHCERFACAEQRWTALPSLPRACQDASGIVTKMSLYVVGGKYRGADLDCVQELSLESLTWKLMQLRLPIVSHRVPCFKVSDTQVYLVVNKTLFALTVLQVSYIKTLTEDIESFNGASYYCRGTLYCSSSDGPVRRQTIGSLIVPTFKLL
jgi:hypothetical protein